MAQFDVNNGDRGYAICRETGNVLRYVLRGDDEAGWLDQYEHDAEGTVTYDNNTGSAKVRRRKLKFIFIRHEA